MIVTREQVRQAVTTRIQSLRASFTAYDLQVEYDNHNTINRSTQTLPFLAITFVYSDGYQTSLGQNSQHRPLGTIVVEAFDKEGAGTARINALLDHFYRGLHMTDTMPPVRTYAARFSSKLPWQGWVAQAALIPFWYDTE
jgi:hypothetical protein